MLSGKPKDPTLALVPEEGAAAVLVEALTAAGFTATVRRVPYNPFRPAETGTTFEVRVPQEQLAGAERVVAALSLDVAKDLEAQALAEPAAVGPADPK